MSVATASAAGGLYQTPDNRLIERRFEANGYPLPKVVVLCPSREDYLTGLRKFADYFLADKDITIIDGRSAETPDGATVVLLMHEGDPVPADCVAKSPDLEGLYAEFAATHTKQIDAKVVIPGLKPGTILPIFASLSYRPGEHGGPSAAVVGLCAIKGGLCESALYEPLFGLSPYLCGTGDLCGFLR